MICCILRINQKRFLSSFRYRIFNYLRLILNSDSVVKYSFNLYINFACYLTDIQAPSISLLSSLLPTIYTSNMHDSPPLRVHNYDAIEKEMQNIWYMLFKLENHFKFKILCLVALQKIWLILNAAAVRVLQVYESNMSLKYWQPLIIITIIEHANSLEFYWNWPFMQCSIYILWDGNRPPPKNRSKTYTNKNIHSTNIVFYAVRALSFRMQVHFLEWFRKCYIEVIGLQKFIFSCFLLSASLSLSMLMSTTMIIPFICEFVCTRVNLNKFVDDCFRRN